MKIGKAGRKRSAARKANRVKPMSQHIADLKAAEAEQQKQAILAEVKKSGRGMSVAGIVWNLSRQVSTFPGGEEVWDTLLALEAAGQVVRETRKGIPHFMVRFTAKERR